MQANRSIAIATARVLAAYGTPPNGVTVGDMAGTIAKGFLDALNPPVAPVTGTVNPFRKKRSDAGVPRGHYATRRKLVTKKAEQPFGSATLPGLLTVRNPNANGNWVKLTPGD